MLAYAARLGYGPLSVRVAETMHWRAGTPAPPGRTVFGGALPVVSAEGIDWSCPRLDATGHWHPVVAALPATILHEDPAGRIEWTCFCPAARTAVRLAGHHYAGSGYAERLVMTLPAAQLPLRELHWGRFIADTQSCVWIRWHGPVERSWCYHNGQPVAACAPDLHELAWDGHRLQLDPGAIIRSGRITETSFRDLPRWLHGLLPAAARKFDETKWCSPGVLTDAAGARHSGWAIHEIVRFP